MSACEIYKGITVTSNKLRLYCLRLSDGVLIVGNGGQKKTRTYDERYETRSRNRAVVSQNNR